jgi:threonine dehydratase
MTGEPLSLRDIFAARRRLRPHVLDTPLRPSEWLSEATGATVLLKLESTQRTNSFKFRGAMNVALCLQERGGARRVVTASAGNHGRAMALAAQRLGFEAVVFTPSTAPETKRAAIRRLGADLRDDAPDYDAAERLAREYAAERDVPYISPYNNRDVIAGAGTVALEILEEAPDTTHVIVPLGGGGLASGVALALKSAAPHVTVVGVEVDASQPFGVSLPRGAITAIDVKPSLADGLIGNLEPGSMTFPLVQKYVDRVVSVGEDDLQRAMRGLAAEEHVIAEGAGATATAALLSSPIASSGHRVVCLVTGGNVDHAVLARLLASGDNPTVRG